MENFSFLEAQVMIPAAGWLLATASFRKIPSWLWLSLSASLSGVMYVILWIDLAYWPWYMFVLLWLATMLSVFCGCMTKYTKSPNERTISFNMLCLAQATFGAHVSVIGALHVLDVGVTITMVVSSAVGMLLAAPHWAAIMTDFLLLGEFSSAAEIRLVATTVAILLSPFHHMIKGHWIGSVLAIFFCLSIILPMRSIYKDMVLTVNASNMLTVVNATIVQVFLCCVPSIGMELWAMMDNWISNTSPVTFVGLIVFANVHLVTRLYFDRVAREPRRVVTLMEFLPYFGVASCYFAFVPQPLVIALIYLLAVGLTGLFLYKTATSLSSQKMAA